MSLSNTIRKAYGPYTIRYIYGVIYTHVYVYMYESTLKEVRILVK